MAPANLTQHLFQLGTPIRELYMGSQSAKAGSSSKAIFYVVDFPPAGSWRVDQRGTLVLVILRV